MKLLLTGAFKYTKEHFDNLKKMGHQLYFVQDERIPLNEQKKAFSVQEIEGVICNGLFLYNDISEFKSLRFIQLTSAGYDRVPMDYIEKNQIQIYNARGVYSKPMAEWAVLSALELYKNAYKFRDSQKKHLWEKQRNLQELTEKTVLIVGCGNVACEVAKRFKAFETKIVGIDKYPRQSEYFDEMFGLEVLDEYVQMADIVILTVPLTEETHHLFGKERLAQLKESAILINISRGKVVNEEALYNALSQNKLAGAALDVFEQEPLNVESPLWDLEQVIVTPHNSFVSDKNDERMFKVIMENLSR